MKTREHFEVRYYSSKASPCWVTISHDAGSLEDARRIVAESRQVVKNKHQIVKVVTTTEVVG